MRSLVIAENSKIAAVMENDKALDFFVSKNELGLGDIYSVTVENIMPSIDAVFVNLGGGRMGFLHANDVPGSRRDDLRSRINPGQKLLVQIVKEPTGKKGPRVNPSISLPGRYFVLTTDHANVSISRRIADADERNRLKTVATLMKPEEVGLVIRTEAAGCSEAELEEDFVNTWSKWRNITEKHERARNPGLIHKEQDFLYMTLRDAFNNSVDEIVVDSSQAAHRTEQLLKTWTDRDVSIRNISGDSILYESGVEKEIKAALSNRVDLPSGGYIIIQTTEALTAIDINSGRFTSSNTLRETVRRTNMEASVEIARQMRLRNIGGMIIVDYIDMSDRTDRIAVMETMEQAVRADKAKPQIGQISDLCLVEITRKRSGQALREIFGDECPHCGGLGIIFNLRGSSGQDSQHQGSSRRHRGTRDNRDRDNRNDSRRGGGRRDNRDRDNRNDSRRGGRTSGRRDWSNKDDSSGSSSSHRSRNTENREQQAGSGDNVKDLTKSKTFSSTHLLEKEAPASKTSTKPSPNGKSDEASAEPKRTSRAAKPAAANTATEDLDTADKKKVVRRMKSSRTLQRLVKRRAKSSKSDESGSEETSQG